MHRLQIFFSAANKLEHGHELVALRISATLDLTPLYVRVNLEPHFTYLSHCEQGVCMVYVIIYLEYLYPWGDEIIPLGPWALRRGLLI